MELTPVKALLALFAATTIVLSVQSKHRLDVIQGQQVRIESQADRIERLVGELERAQYELGTCLQDGEALEAALNVATTDLRRCDQFYAQRAYERHDNGQEIDL